MMPPKNRAAWLREKQSPELVIDDAPYTSPGPDEVTIKVKAVAINPVDWGIQDHGIIVQHYPAILGCDVSGVVEEAGVNLTATFKPGDHVIGLAQPLASGEYQYAGFQQYVVLKFPLIAKIPDTVPFSDAAVLPLGIYTASTSLFLQSCLDLTIPPNKTTNREILIVWGASSSVGACGVQLAVAAGYTVIGVCSRRNHQLVKSLGATICFDQSEETVPQDILSYLHGIQGQVVGAYDAVSSPFPWGSTNVGTLSDILQHAGSRAAKVICVVQPGLESHARHGVKVTLNLNVLATDPSIDEAVWQGYLKDALLSGEFQYKPSAEIVGEGLESLQTAFRIQKNGVSAKKIVVIL